MERSDRRALVGTEILAEMRREHTADFLHRHNQREAVMPDFDPQEFGRMQAQIETLRRDNDELLSMVKELSAEVRAIRLQLTEAKGGWRMLMLLGGGAAAAGGTVMAIAQRMFKVLG
jgi:malate synthase